MKKRLGSFLVAEDGTLSLHGQSEFNVYASDGGLVSAIATFRLHEDGETVTETRTSTFNPENSNSFTYSLDSLEAATRFSLRKL